MRYYYKMHKGIGTALVIVGPICFLSGIIVTSIFCVAGNSAEYNYNDYSKQVGTYSEQANEYSSQGGNWAETQAKNARKEADKYREKADEAEGRMFTNYFIGGFVGANLMTAGVVMTLCCIYPFVLSQRIYSIYRKSTGQKLTFFDRTTFGGGYDWENKELMFTMAIKL